MQKLGQIFISIALLLPRYGRGSGCTNGPCWPGNDVCGKQPANSPIFHLHDQHGCGENDPNGPVFDPVHGIIHHFYQDHLAALDGAGPIYGHFVSRDFVHWAQLPVAIWNGLDVSEDPPRVTRYDTNAIYTGSGVVVDGAGPGGVGPGVVQIYPGLCKASYWPGCKTGTLLAQAVPANYADDPLLTNWTKPSYNPIVENTQRDPTTPWKTPEGEWRLRTYDALYGSSSDADLVAGKWYKLGDASAEWPVAECPSFYQLPGPTPGFEDAYEAAQQSGQLPTHVEKTSGGGDWWRAGTYDPGQPRTPGKFSATPGWEDLWPAWKIDQGNFYASKDNLYPEREGKAPRRINWGWVTLGNGVQSLPREITFNAAVRRLEQAPIEELTGLRKEAVSDDQDISLQADVLHDLALPSNVAKHSEIVVNFALPSSDGTFGVLVGALGGAQPPYLLACSVEYTRCPNASWAFYEVPVACGGLKDTLRLTPAEKSLELRIFLDGFFMEAYFQRGRVAMTLLAQDCIGDRTTAWLISTTPVIALSASVYPMQSMWTSPEEVRAAPRLYPATTAAKSAARSAPGERSSPGTAQEHIIVL